MVAATKGLISGGAASGPDMAAPIPAETPTAV
jgi:hypothetical protein